MKLVVSESVLSVRNIISFLTHFCRITKSYFHASFTSKFHDVRSPCPYCELDVIHLAGHLTLTHGLKPSDAKDLVEATSGKEAARTDLQWTAFSQQKTNLID